MRLIVLSVRENSNRWGVWLEWVVSESRVLQSSTLYSFSDLLFDFDRLADMLAELVMYFRSIASKRELKLPKTQVWRAHWFA